MTVFSSLNGIAGILQITAHSETQERVVIYK
jgi:hypothetical protein